MADNREQYSEFYNSPDYGPYTTPAPWWTQPFYTSGYPGEPSKYNTPSLNALDQQNKALRSRREMLRAQIADWESLKLEFGGPVDFITRWMIDNKIRDLKNSLSSISSNIMSGWAEEERQMALAELEPGMTQEELDAAASRWERAERAESEHGGGWDYPQEKTPPIPAWMQKYFEKSVSGLGKQWEAQETSMYGKRRSAKEPSFQEKGAYAFMPIGAQEELDPEQLAMMAGYLGWTKAGAPTEFSEEYASKMAMMPAWWEYETKKWTDLFPSNVKLPASWRISKQ